jgi:hypothetical protein
MGYKQTTERFWVPTSGAGRFFERNMSKKLEKEIERFNKKHPVGTKILYWTGIRQGVGKESVTNTEARLLGGHTPVVWVEGHGPCVALTHIEPVVD